MKLEILKAFSDKVTGEMREVGQVIDFKADRAKELLEHPLHLVKKVEDKAKAEAVEVADKVENAVETADKKPVVKRATKPAAKK